MDSMSMADSMVVMWFSSSPPFSPQAVAYSFDRFSQVRSRLGVIGTKNGRL
jgi:hypothetical protein